MLVQSACPDDPAIRFACHHDYAAFVEHELAHRRATNTPPFTALARVILRGPDEAVVAETARGMTDVLRAAAGESSEIRILGPAPAPIARVKNFYRFHLQLAAPGSQDIRELWLSVEKQLPRQAGVESVIDVDPLSLR